ncbi:hypothetical protein LIER_03358 [Lithospermum erythrorhizon]|uniref:Uncharacterized protein n=1 Tax=Lithospermum erythrorhizon TaxID=34254 RepID=A0AAV3NXI4_LITER
MVSGLTRPIMVLVLPSINLPLFHHFLRLGRWLYWKNPVLLNKLNNLTTPLPLFYLPNPPHPYRTPAPNPARLPTTNLARQITHNPDPILLTGLVLTSLDTASTKPASSERSSLGLYHPTAMPAPTCLSPTVHGIGLNLHALIHPATGSAALPPSAQQFSHSPKPGLLGPRPLNSSWQPTTNQQA